MNDSYDDLNPQYNKLQKLYKMLIMDQKYEFNSSQSMY